MKKELELRAVGEAAVIPTLRRVDQQDAVRNIAAAEARIAAQQKLERMEREIEMERQRQPNCSASRSDFFIEGMIVAGAGAAAMALFATVVSLV